MTQDIGCRTNIVELYLDQMVRQHEAVFARLEGLDETVLWKRPSPGEWCIGENLDHARAIYGSLLPIFHLSWHLWKPVAWLRRKRPYPVDIDNAFKRQEFLRKMGWFCTPRFSPRRPTSLLLLKEDIARDHQQVILFYRGKSPDLLGNLYLYDTLLGWINLIQALRVGLYHDQLHYDAVENILKTKNIRRVSFTPECA